MRKISVFSVLAISIIAMAGCTSIPKESVTLSQSIGENITNIHQSNIKLVNLYFEQSKRKVDELAEKAVNTFFKSIARQVRDENSPKIDEQALQKIKDKIMGYYADAMKYKEQLEKTRVLIIDRLNNEYMITTQANATITGLLQSHVEHEKATESGIKTLKDISKGGIDLYKVRDKVDEYINKAGEFSGEMVILYEEIKKLIDSQPQEN